MIAWILLALLVVGIAVVVRLIRPRDDFLRLGRDPRERHRAHDLTLPKRTQER